MRNTSYFSFADVYEDFFLGFGYNIKFSRKEFMLKPIENCKDYVNAFATTPSIAL
jgi:hypothetical protein